MKVCLCQESENVPILNNTFSVLSKCTSKYLNSPLYKGASLRDELEKNVQLRSFLQMKLGKRSVMLN